jgi:hypothetical protein
MIIILIAEVFLGMKNLSLSFSVRLGDLGRLVALAVVTAC